MKKVIIDGKERMVTDRHAFLLEASGKLEVKEEKKVAETKENKKATGRKTK